MAGNDQDLTQMTSAPEPMGQGDVPPISNPLREGISLPPVRDPQIINKALSMPQGGGLNTQSAMGMPPQPMSGLGAILGEMPQEASNRVTPHMPTPAEAFGMANNNVSDKIAEIQNEIGNKLKSSQIPWFQLASAFLSPGRTGSFGEALGAATGAMGKYQEEQQAQRLPLMQAGLKAAELGKQEAVKGLIGNLYEPVKDEAGNTTYKFNPTVAQQLAQATGDPKYASMIVDETMKQQVRSLKGSLFSQPDGSVGINHNAFQGLYALDSKDALDTIKAIPEMRRFGILPSTGAEGTPFDALAMVAEGPFKAQAINLAERYKKGLIKDEDADKMTNQLLTAMTAHMDKESARATTVGIHSVAQSIAQDRLDQSKKELELKHEDKQKKDEALKNQTIDSADNVLNAIDLIKNHPGRMNGLSSYDPRQLAPGTKEYDFVHQMEGLKSGVFSSAVQNMRGLGSLSNAEGQKVMNLYGSLNTGMSKEAFDHTLNVISDTMGKAKERAKKQYSTGSQTQENVVDFSSLPKKAK
jgi:hypothetical protein